MIVDRPLEHELTPIIHAMLAHLDEAQQQIQLEKLRDYSYQNVVGDKDDLLSGLFVCRSGEQIVAAIWSHRLPGQSVIVGEPVLLDHHAPKMVASESPKFSQRLSPCQLQNPNDGNTEQEIQAVTALIRHTCDWIATRPGSMAQVVLDVEEPAASEARDAKKAIGATNRVDTSSIQFWAPFQFQQLAQLVYVLKTVDKISATDPNSFPAKKSNEFKLTLESGDWNLSPERWQAILEATYQDSLDCPALNGRRETLDTLRGYQATATYMPDGWWIVTDPDNMESDLGCVVMADHPENDLIELVYIGVAAGSRGQGLGRALFSKILDFVQRKKRAHLLAAVDSGNLPALKLYREYGFGVMARKNVLARFFQ